MRTIILLDKHYENGSRVVVTNKGVIIWDATCEMWVVDASCIAEDSEIRVSDVTKPVVSRQHYFRALYPKPRMKRKKRKTSSASEVKDG